MSDKNKEKKEIILNKGTTFVFTDFKESNVENGYHQIFDEYSDMIRGLAWGKEICPDSGKLHNQGFIQVFTQTRFSALKKWFKSKCHFEVMFGNIEQNEKYCSKDGFYTKLGYFCNKGYRTDWHNIKEDIRNGSSMYDIMENYTSHFGHYVNGIKAIKTEIDNKILSTKIRNLECTIIYGATGVGKTTAILNQYDLNDVYVLQNPDKDNKNWNGYDGQKVLVIDDFYGWIRPSEMLRLLDGKPYRVRKLNGFSWAQFEKVYITSNCCPLEWWQNADIPTEVLEAVWRRCQNFCLEVLSRGNTDTLDIQKRKLGNYVKPKKFLTFSDIANASEGDCTSVCELESSDEDEPDEKKARSTVLGADCPFLKRSDGICRTKYKYVNVPGVGVMRCYAKAPLTSANLKDRDPLRFS